MLMGYKVNELQLNLLYDDGTPAQNVEVEVYSNGKLIAEGRTDGDGIYIFRPGPGSTGDLTFVSFSAGHKAELNLDLEEERGTDELPVPMKVAAGLGYLLGLAGLSMIYVSRRK